MSSITLISELQHCLGFADSLLRQLSLHTYSTHYLAFTLLLYWCGYCVSATRIGCGVLFSTLVFGSCRQFFHSPRPYWEHPQLFNGLYEKAWGMPSGHSQLAVTFWGLSAIHLKLRLFCFFAPIMILAIAISRLYLGLHYPEQVVAGLTLGVILITLWTRLESTFLGLIPDQALSRQIITLLLLTSSPLLITLFFREVLDIDPGNASELTYKRLFFYSGLLNAASISLLLAFTRYQVTAFSPDFNFLSPVPCQV